MDEKKSSDLAGGLGRDETAPWEAHAHKSEDGLDGIGVVPLAMIVRYAKAAADRFRRETPKELAERMLADFAGVITQQAAGRLSPELIQNAPMRAALTALNRANDILRAQLPPDVA